MQNKPSKILMIRPIKFGFNLQTAESNSFQQQSNTETSEEIQKKALEEFDAFTEKLISNGIDVIIYDDTDSPHTPDSIFPNNWLSFHENNELVLYPMLAENRRLERREDIIAGFKKSNTTIIDLTKFENKKLFLEGTGSIVFDYEYMIAYANSSPRTDKNLFEQLCKQLNFESILFKAVDSNGSDIYHTNVLMCIGSGFTVVCEDAIPDKNDLERIVDSLKASKHELIKITVEQMNSFAGNMYQLYNFKGESFIVMSEQAFKSLLPTQVKQLEQYGTILYSPLYTIEKHGGGSARCMLADIRS
ncbi:arginine deiminase-related protein [soil metagenome]